MATGNFILDKGYDAVGAIRKYRAVKLVGEEQVSECTATSDVVFGVSQFGATTTEIAAGKGAAVRRQGRAEWECGAAVAIGVYVMSDSQGRCIPATAGLPVAGRCDGDASTLAGEYVSIDLDQKKSLF